MPGSQLIEMSLAELELDLQMSTLQVVISTTYILHVCVYVCIYVYVYVYVHMLDLQMSTLQV